MKFFLSALALVGLSIYLLNLWMTHFWYKASEYSFGVKNMTSEMLRGVEVQLVPEGDFVFGSVAPDAEKVFVDPQWVKPTQLLVKWIDGDSALNRSFDVDITDDFQGNIWVVFKNLKTPDLVIEERN